MRSGIERMDPLSDDARYKVLKFLASHPEASQRDVAQHLGVSVGKVNYCIRALMQKGWIKVQNFKNSRHKSAYLYLLTPAGVDQRVQLTVQFLQRKVVEYDRLAAEIETLRAEIASENRLDTETVTP
jgi:EPS-associated MarR family transcriptional regulator